MSQQTRIESLPLCAVSCAYSPTLNVIVPTESLLNFSPNAFTKQMKSQRTVPRAISGASAPKKISSMPSGAAQSKAAGQQTRIVFDLHWKS